MNAPLPYRLVLCFLALLPLNSKAGAEPDAGFPKFPLRNGDFSCSQGWDRPTNWEPATNSGKHDFIMDPPATFVNSPSAALIRTRESGSAYYYQTVSLLEGDYVLTVDVSGTDQTTVRVGLGPKGKDAKVGKKWMRLSVPASGLKGKTTVSLHSNSKTDGLAKFREVKLEPSRLAGAAIAFEDGSRRDVWLWFCWPRFGLFRGITTRVGLV